MKCTTEGRTLGLHYTASALSVQRTTSTARTYDGAFVS